MMELETKYARFLYDKEDYDLINALEEYLTENAERIFEFFEDSLPREKVIIHIFKTKREYDEIIKARRKVEEIPKWQIGNSHDNTIEYVSLHDYKSTSHAFKPEDYDRALEEYKRTMLHEYVHFVLRLYCQKNNINRPLRFLNEGLAEYLSKQWDNKEAELTASLDELINSNNCYLGWYLLTNFIIENYGREYFIRLIANNDYAIKETPRLYEEAKNHYKNIAKTGI